MGVGTGGKVGTYRLSDGGQLRSAATPFFGAGLRFFTTMCALAVFVCSAFAAAAGCVLMLLYMRGDFTEDPGFFLRLALKTAFFSLTTIGSGWALRRQAPMCIREAPCTREETRATSSTFAVLFIAAAATMLLVLPNLGAYPWPAPDEMHHLIVARNLAEHGSYASGHPDGSLIYFDPYDSVGPPVILPVAAAFKVFGSELAPARIVIALFYFALCAFVFLLMRRPFGPTPAAGAVLMMTMAFGSVYLARSLYGEVPALMFLLAGLWCWGRALDSVKSVALPLAAGLCFGLAVLTKTFVLIGAWAFVGVWLYDRLTYKRIALRHVALPLAGMFAVPAAWAAVEFAYRHLASGEGSTLVYYRHSLMFGLDSLPSASTLLLTQALPILAAVSAFIFVAPRVFRDRYDPPTMVLFLLAVLFAFWWIFFTPARIPRYMWYSCAIAGMFAGTFMCYLLGRVLEGKRRMRWAAPALAMAALIVGTGVMRVVPQLQFVLLEDRVKSERDLARYLEALPTETRIATTYWPAQRSANFLADRSIAVIDPAAENHPDYDTIVYSTRVPPVPSEAFAKGVTIGHYVVLTTRSNEEDPSNDR
ncbi:MAG: glycosyltransferase family 39 protein [Proteobacteria bacterium]|nr:glycosyltransferase family 39 protein [Pseudomonadota bacterium]